MLKGIGVSSGVAIGKIKIIEDDRYAIEKKIVENETIELQRFSSALEASRKQIQKIHDKAMAEIGKDEAGIFEAHLMILEDEAYIKEIEKLIQDEKLNAEFAADKITGKYIEMFNGLDDAYLKERAADLKDVSTRIIRNILGITINDYNLKEEVIIAANDLTPSDTASLDKKYVLGFLTEEGGAASHSAIMARTLEIPAVVGVEGLLDSIRNNEFIILDGDTGDIISNPGVKQLEKYSNKKENLLKSKKIYSQYKDKETVTIDNKKVVLAANIGSPADLDTALNNGCEGIGLFRTELFYLERTSLPSEDEQFEVYKSLAEKMEDKPVIIRTLDVGGDKEIPYMDLPKEMNPFLGYRAIRLCLEREDIFLTQLKAILRASFYGNIKILFPMISSMEELMLAKEFVKKAEAALTEKGIPFNENIEAGIMIEVPSAALMSGLMAREADFFSIGTNDLIQYTSAVDRGNKKVSHLYTEFNPGVLMLIKQVIQNAHKEGIWVGMCGEAASNSRLVPLLLAMGLDEFSMNSANIPQIRCLINNMKYEDAKKLLDVLNYGYIEKIKDKLDQFIKDNCQIRSVGP